MTNIADIVYFVGRKLCDEYASLLQRTKRSAGTALRIRKNRLNIDKMNQTLDVNRTYSFKNQAEVFIISGPNKIRPRNNISSNGYRRFMIWNNACILLEVEPRLVDASIHDDCAEIYAEIDFPLNVPERIPLTKESQPQNETGPKEEKQKEKKEVDEERKERRKEKKREKKAKRAAEKEKTVPPMKVSNVGTLKMVELKPYGLDKEERTQFTKMSGLDREAFYQEKLDEWIDIDIFTPYEGRPHSDKSDRNERLETYFNQRTIMLFMEEVEHINYLKQLKGHSVMLTHFKDRQFAFSITDELRELVIDIENNAIEQANLCPINNKSRNFLVQMCGIQEQRIIVEIGPKQIHIFKSACKDGPFIISFKLNRLPYQMQHYAWEFLAEQDLLETLIYSTSYHCKSPEIVRHDHVLQSDGTILKKLNKKQQLVIKSFLERDGTEPYILIGPTGTGKTLTLIALVEQIVRTTTQNVLISAPSNVACDEITEQLLNILKEDEMYRFYGNSCKYVETRPRIREVSNVFMTEIFYPPLEFLYSVRVIICTASSAGYLTRARIDQKWSVDHFGYVIIDDCATMTQSMSLIPIAGLCTTAKKIHAKILLAGDTKQLDIKIRSKMGREVGNSKSLLEELCGNTLYSRDEETGLFNNMFITQLVENYRSHPEIVRISSELFYENAMQPLFHRDDTYWFIDSEYLPSKKFPLIFRSTQGKCEQHSNNNCFNEAEIKEVISTIEQLLKLPQLKKVNKSGRARKCQIMASDIGVVPPYHIQCSKIANTLQGMNVNGVDIGTAESFQGKDKQVMIISTVRTDGDIRDVASPHWMNFVLNRAKSLVVIIGNAETLEVDTNWFRVIEHCTRNESLIGCDNI